jgi:hypothetical protein
MATKNRAKGGTMKTNGTKKSAAKAAAQGGVKAAAKGSVKAAAKKTKKDATKGPAHERLSQAARMETKIHLVPDGAKSAELIDEPPPSISTPPIRRLTWGYALLSELGDDAMQSIVVEAGTKVAVEGNLERLAYVYVVQIGADDRSVEVLYPPAGGSRRMRPGARMRIPSGTGWIVTTKKGRLRTIASTYPLTEEQIAALG